MSSAVRARAGARDLAAELRTYPRVRDTAALPMYELTCGLAHIEAPPTPRMQQLLAALPGQPRHISRFLGIIAGSVPVREFFSPESMAEVFGTAQAA